MEGQCVVTELDQVIQAALSYEASSMSDPHANFDAELEYAEQMLREAVINFVESNYAVMVPQ